MAAPMNTFAVVLLAFPFYLAQKGRLAAYVELAKPSNAQASDGSVAQSSGTPAQSNSNFGLADLASLPALTELFA